MNSNSQNPVSNADRLPDPPTSYIVFIDGNMAGKQLKCSCGRIYAWLDKANIMTSESRNDPIISAFLKQNYHYNTSIDNRDLYSSHSNKRYSSPPRTSDRDYYRYNNERSRRSPSPYHRSQSRHSNHRERRRSRSYSESRSRSRSPSGRRKSYHYNDDYYTRYRDNRYEGDRKRDYPVNSNQAPVIQYSNQNPIIQPPQPPPQQQQQIPAIQSIVQPFPPRQSLPLQNQVPKTTNTSPPVNNNNNKNQQTDSWTSASNPVNNNSNESDSWTSVSNMDSVWASYDDIKPSSAQSPPSSFSRGVQQPPPQQQQQQPSLRQERMNNYENMNSEASQSPLSDSDNSSINSNYPEMQQQQQQQQNETVPQYILFIYIITRVKKVWDIPRPINELGFKYPGKTMDDVGREQLISDVQEYNRDKGLNSDRDAVEHSVDYQMTKNRVLLRLEWIVTKYIYLYNILYYSTDQCPLSRISSLYEEKYGEKLDLQKDLGYKKLSKCLEMYGFKLQPMQNLTIVTPSKKIWF